MSDKKSPFTVVKNKDGTSTDVVGSRPTATQARRFQAPAAPTPTAPRTPVKGQELSLNGGRSTPLSKAETDTLASTRRSIIRPIVQASKFRQRASKIRQSIANQKSSVRQELSSREAIARDLKPRSEAESLAESIRPGVIAERRKQEKAAS